MESIATAQGASPNVVHEWSWDFSVDDASAFSQVGTVAISANQLTGSVLAEDASNVWSSCAALFQVPTNLAGDAAVQANMELRHGCGLVWAYTASGVQNSGVNVIQLRAFVRTFEGVDYLVFSRALATAADQAPGHFPPWPSANTLGDIPGSQVARPLSELGLSIGDTVDLLMWTDYLGWHLWVDGAPALDFQYRSDVFAQYQVTYLYFGVMELRPPGDDYTTNPSLLKVNTLDVWQIPNQSSFAANPFQDWTSGSIPKWSGDWLASATGFVMRAQQQAGPGSTPSINVNSVSPAPTGTCVWVCAETATPGNEANLGLRGVPTDFSLVYSGAWGSFQHVYVWKSTTYASGARDLGVNPTGVSVSHSLLHTTASDVEFAPAPETGSTLEPTFGTWTPTLADSAGGRRHAIVLSLDGAATGAGNDGVSVKPLNFVVGSALDPVTSKLVWLAESVSRTDAVHASSASLSVPSTWTWTATRSSAATTAAYKTSIGKADAPAQPFPASFAATQPSTGRWWVLQAVSTDPTAKPMSSFSTYSWYPSPNYTPKVATTSVTDDTIQLPTYGQFIWTGEPMTTGSSHRRGFRPTSSSYTVTMEWRHVTSGYNVQLMTSSSAGIVLVFNGSNVYWGRAGGKGDFYQVSSSLASVTPGDAFKIVLSVPAVSKQVTAYGRPKYAVTDAVINDSYFTASMAALAQQDDFAAAYYTPFPGASQWGASELTPTVSLYKNDGLVNTVYRGSPNWNASYWITSFATYNVFPWVMWTSSTGTGPAGGSIRDVKISFSASTQYGIWPTASMPLSWPVVDYYAGITEFNTHNLYATPYLGADTMGEGGF